MTLSIEYAKQLGQIRWLKFLMFFFSYIVFFGLFVGRFFLSLGFIRVFRGAEVWRLFCVTYFWVVMVFESLLWWELKYLCGLQIVYKKLLLR
jgi:hypothetical protein